MMVIARKPALLLAAVLCLGATLSAQQADAQSIGDEIDALRAEYAGQSAPEVDPFDLGVVRSVAERMTDAEIYFAVGEYARAALHLAPLVEDEGLADHPAYPRARHLLAESLFQDNALELASGYFEDGLGDEYDRQATIRLLDIAIERRDIEAIDRYAERLTTRYGQSGDSEILYMRARAAYAREDYPGALAFFERVAPDHELASRARYHAAVALTRSGERGAALERFQQLERELAALSGRSAADEDVLQLSRLAQGILHYEAEEWDRAVDAYASVERGTEAFEQALYQIAWTLIREERYADAVTNFEILALLSENSRFVAESRLLSSEMRRRAEEYDVAMQGFEDVSRDYGIVLDEMEAAAANADLSAAERFDAVAEIDTLSVLAPFRIEDWLIDDPLFRRALRIVRQADQLGDWLEESQELSDEIDELLNSGAALDRMPELQEYYAELVAGRAQSVRMRAEILERLRRERPAPEDPSYERVRERADRALDELERTPTDYAGFQEQVAAEAGRLRQELIDVYRVEQQFLNELDNVQAMREMVRARELRGQQSPDVAAHARVELDAAAADLERRLEEVQQSRIALERSTARFGLGETLDRTWQRMDRIDRQLSDELALLGGADESDYVLGQLNGVLQERREEVRQRSEYAWSQARRVLNEETRALVALNTEYRRQRAEELALAEELAMEGYRAVQGRVEDVAMRADLGIIDVAWWRKESVSERIEALFDEKDRQLQVLEADFSELRE